MAPIRIRTLTVHTVLKMLFVMLAGAGLLAYGTYQARDLIGGPAVTLHPSTSVVEDSPVVSVAGYAQNITKITLNGRPIHTDEGGAFSESVILQEGHTIVTLAAEDRYGRTTSVTRSYVYRGSSLEGQL